MSIRIVVDSTCDVPEPVAAEHGIAIIPAYVNIDGQSYLDGVELSRQAFYDRLPAAKSPPTTSTPGVGAFVELYERLAAEGAREILSVHLAGTLSTMINVASVAAETVRSVKVTTFDSRQLSAGAGLLALAAARAAEAGHSMQEIVAELKEKARHTYLFAVLETMEFLQRSGRVSRLQLGLGSLLKIKPLTKVYDGEVNVEKVRTQQRAVERMASLLDELGPLEDLAFLHTRAPEAARALNQAFQRFVPVGQAPMHVEVTPVIGAHVGPGAVGVSVIARGG